MTSYDLSSQASNYDDLAEMKQDVLALAFRKRRYSTAGTLGSIEVSYIIMITTWYFFIRQLFTDQKECGVVSECKNKENIF